MATAALPASRPDEHRLRGIALRIGSVTALSVMFALMKLASTRGANTVEIAFYRNLFGMPFLIAYIALVPGLAAVRTRRPLVHVTRTAIGLTSLMFNVQALAMLPLADATAIGFMAPLIATFLSAVLLREHVGAHRWFALALGLLGVVVLIQPGQTPLPPLAVAVGLAAALGVASVNVTVRQIAARETATAIVFWFSALCLVALFVPLLLTATRHPAEVWIILGCIGVFGAAGQMMLTASLRFAPIAVLAPFDYLQLVSATGLGFLFWAAVPDAHTLIGAGLIAAGGIFTIYREHRLHRERTGLGPPAA
ncbi:DMT family transporter [Flavisphingomonas formosensis]|uniref:DMT family transporter n=1 Tax=Flavisphingomonas formosensis TaxID=861534 RepID=UPI001E3A0DF3|nr:DMT family transporter [Sphingomonas formosensis]